MVMSPPREPLIVDDVSQDERFYRAFQSSDFSTANIICVPLVARGKVIGVLQVLNKTSGEQFNLADHEVLMAFAAQSATAIENAVREARSFVRRKVNQDISKAIRAAGPFNNRSNRGWPEAPLEPNQEPS